jgi:amidophosphoribosyltransferase
MSDPIKHECGIGMIRFLKPMEYYQAKYGSWMYGIQKLYLLMEKQHNRGQDGAGVVNVKFDLKPGEKYIHRVRTNKSTPIKRIFDKIEKDHQKIRNKNPDLLRDPIWAKKNLPFAGEIYLGHLRYGTYGLNNIEYVHPVMRENNWKSRNLILAGNFNLTNVDELFQLLIKLGQHPKDFSDTETVLEKVGHFLDEENQLLFRQYKDEGYNNKEISELIAENISIRKILQESSKDWDGGYAIAGILGHGDCFFMRDPCGIRPAFYYADNEVVVTASERPVIQTVMNVSAEEVREVSPGHALIVKRNGKISEEPIRVNSERKSCSFERIYFSRGSDKYIYRERKKLGELLVPDILEAVNYDLDNTVFSFIPNTAEVAYYGLLSGLEDYQRTIKQKKILENKDQLDAEFLASLLAKRIRAEKIAVKDVKLRTFIAQESGRKDLVGHVYDVTYGILNKGVDNLVILDDSIVRGTTLRESILQILDRLKPAKIVVVSSSPQIRYPDCYGIDMARLGNLVAFQAAIALLREKGMEYVINEVYKKSKAQENAPKEEMVNHVRDIYAPFSQETVSKKISSILKADNIHADVQIVYQKIENLHLACPNDRGDWYFTGNYPTPGGNKVVNRAFIDFIEGRDRRAY